MGIIDIYRLSEDRKRVLIVGGGFGGIELAGRLNTRKYDVLLVDKHNYHTFQPLLYQVATGGLEPDSIAYPLRKILSGKKHVTFRMAEVKSIDPSRNEINTTIGQLPYDFLVIAIGSTTNFFGMDELQRNSLSLKSVTDALNIRSFILQNFESSLLAGDLAEQKRLMNFVVVGGGPTGVEVAGALAELKKHVLPADYPELDLNNMEITLVESNDKVLAAMSAYASAKAKKQLESLGVKLKLNSQLVAYDGTNARFKDGSSIATNALIWTAGVKGNLLPGLPEEAILKGRLLVDSFNRLKGSRNIFAVGDIAVVEGNPHPMLAPVAIQQAKNLAKNLNGSESSTWKEFKYVDKGTMATIGRSRAVADLGFIHLKGLFAWLAWLFIHLILLVGFRNRLVVLVNWFWNYFSYDRAIRLIIRPYRKSQE